MSIVYALKCMHFFRKKAVESRSNHPSTRTQSHRYRQTKPSLPLSISFSLTRTRAHTHTRLRCIPLWAASRKPSTTSRSPSQQPPTPPARPSLRASHASAVRSPSLYQSRRLSLPSRARMLLLHLLLLLPLLLLALLVVNKALHASLPPPKTCRFPTVPGRTRINAVWARPRRYRRRRLSRPFQACQRRCSCCLTSALTGPCRSGPAATTSGTPRWTSRSSRRMGCHQPAGRMVDTLMTVTAAAASVIPRKCRYEGLRAVDGLGGL